MRRSTSAPLRSERIVPNLELPRAPWIVGHRGAAGEVIENTLASFERALDAGADMIELDVQMTRDGKLLCFHDWTLERIAGSSVVVEASEAEVVTGIRLAPGGARVPLLRDVLEALPESTALNLELKRKRASRRSLARKLLEEIGDRSQILVSSFDWKLLGELRKLAPELPLAPLERRQPLELLEAGKALGAFSLHCHRNLVTRHFVERADAEGFERILAYTVNDEQLAEELLAAGLKGIFTDLPSRLVGHLKGSR